MVDSTDNVLNQGSGRVSSQADQGFAQSGQVDFDGPAQVGGAILVADCGSSFTRVSLLERVDTGFCFIAHATMPTTAEPPWSDISVGVRHAIEHVAETTGRTLLDGAGSLITPEVVGRGVDLLIVTCSAAQPLRVVLAGLVSQVSLVSLERAAASSYAEVLGVIARDYSGPQSQHQPRDAHALQGLRALPDSPKPESVKISTSLSDEKKIEIIRQHHPDVVWVAGGTDGGSYEPVRDLVETVALACTLVDSRPQPAIVYTGNAELRSQIVELIGEEVDLDIIDNVRPTLDTENLMTAQAAFQDAYVKRKIRRIPGMNNLLEWSSAPLLTTAQAQSYLVQYLERLYESGKGVLCADVGSANTTIATSFPARRDSAKSNQAGNVDSGQHALRIATDLGVGYSAPSLLDRVGVDAIARWLPFEPNPGEVDEVLLNKGLRSTTIPQDRRQLLIEQAAAREALRLVMSQVRETWQTGTSGRYRWLMPFVEPIIASGAVLAQAPIPSQALLMLLDAIEPVGITTVVLDKYGVASALGAVAVAQPVAAVQALDAGAFQKLGTVIAPVGRARPGDVIMRVKVTFEQGSELEVEVEYGSLEVLPLHSGEKAIVELKARRGIRVGQIGGAIEVTGGAVGLVIDARGRPLRLPTNLDRCRQMMQQWLWEMGA